MKRVYPAVLSLVMHEIERTFTGEPTWLDFDEAWHYFSNPVFLEYLRTHMPSWRKWNVNGIFPTQSITQLKGNALTALLKASCKVRIFFPDSAAMDGDIRPHYEEMDLNAKQIETIATATWKEQAYVWRPEGAGLISLPLPRLARLIFASGSKEAQRQMDAVLAQHGHERFPAEWCRAHGFEKEAQAIERGPTNPCDADGLRRALVDQSSNGHGSDTGDRRRQSYAEHLSGRVPVASGQ
jgi:type IV secretion system protein VirB4